MTIATDNNLNQYDGNDATTVFPYTYKINDDVHLVVVLTDTDGNDTTLVLDTDYTVSGVGEASGGNVTYPISGDPLATGEKLTIKCCGAPIKSIGTKPPEDPDLRPRKCTIAQKQQKIAISMKCLKPSARQSWRRN